MNPPSAIHGAMGRERKPFTYTPGGLDLSEIKSERMAKRLMRNAMNQGVPEHTPQAAPQSPKTPSTAIAVPNFNCLPVQVFPAFNLPANPKSLLRTRSTPEQPRDYQSQRVTSAQTNKTKCPQNQVSRETVNNHTPAYSYINNKSNNNSRPPVILEIGSNSSLNRTQCGQNQSTATFLPEICYEAVYLNAAPSNDINKIILNNSKNSDIVVKPLSSEVLVSKLSESNLNLTSDVIIKNTEDTIPEIVIKPLTEMVSLPTEKLEDSPGASDDQKEVKVVKKQTKKEITIEVENQNGNHNGKAEVETEMTVKIPAKKSEAKTETKVEVSKKQLPDGSIEEVKTTTTRTTIDGRTEIKTRTETTITPKAVEIEEEEEEEEVEEAEEENKVKESAQVPKETAKIVTKEEVSESTTTKKVVVVKEEDKQDKVDEEVDEEEEEEEEEVIEIESVKETKPEPPTQKPKPPPQEASDEVKQQKVQQEEDEEEEIEEEELIEEEKVTKESSKVEAEEEEEEDEEEYEEAEETVKPEPKLEATPVEPPKVQPAEEDEESEYTEEEIEDDEPLKPVDPQKEVSTTEETQIDETPTEESKPEEKPEQVSPLTEPKIPLREPSIPLEKVEDVEIKPIGLVTKSHTESTEITTNTTDKPAGVLSTQTEYNRIENIVTVNRTTKTLDNTYEQLTQQGIPTVKTYFAPDRERISTSPSPAKTYQPAFTPQPHAQPERRHSLLLERLSMERQMPSDIYQSSLQNQNYEQQQQQWSQEPQSEVVNVSNVKPSQIANQQWYQQSRKENVIYNNTEPTTPSTAPQQQWAAPPLQPQLWSQPQPQPQPQPQVRTQPQPQSKEWNQPIPPSPQPQYQKSYTENISNDTSRITSNINQNNNYPSYTPNSNWTNNNLSTPLSNVSTQSNQYTTYLNKDSSESYHKTSQEYSSSYVPPPWEQDSHYVAAEIPNQVHTPSYYQSTPSSNNFSPGSKPSWTPSPTSGKFSKPPPTAYIPPAPNQSFVKTGVVEQSKLPGRKTYYSEYERRYISVPETTYIPNETKLQPNASPQYYYDNNEPAETVEHQWRKELREFTEKSSQTQQLTSDSTNVRPPWEEDNKYVKAPAAQPQSWSQTLRPQSWRERSFESEYVGSKSNTIGRSPRPLSSYGTSNLERSNSERTRGVSVDRYNPNNYQSPVPTEHAPVPTHTHNPPITPHSKGYHNPSVPAYHARASAEPREPTTVIPQPRKAWGDSQTTPIQSRSFKYLQWITGTED